MRALIALAPSCACLALAACAPPPSGAPIDDVPMAGPWRVVDDGDGRPARIVDAGGGTVLLRGVNLSQTAKVPPFFPAEIDDADGRATLAAEGPLAVRFLTSWSAIEPEDGVVDDGYLRRLEEVTRALADDGHLIVLDLHQDLYGPAFSGNGAPPWTCDVDPSTFVYQEPWFRNYEAPEVQACFDGLFGDDARLGRMAAALRRAVEAARRGAGASLVGVDLINEPHPGSRAPAAFAARLGRWYEIARDALRDEGGDDADADVLLFFEPDVTHNLGEATHLERAPSPQSAWAPHLYPLDAELGRYRDFLGLDGTLRRYADEAVAFGVPLVIGEYGPIPRDEAAAVYVDDVHFVLDALRAGAFVWDWSAASDRGLLRADVAEDTRAMVLRPTARRVPGVLLAHGFALGDDGSATLTVTFDVDDDARGAVEITVPSRWAPVRVDCSDDAGAVADLAHPGLLRLRPSARGEHTWTVRFERR